MSVLSLADISEVLYVCRGCMGNLKKSIGLHFCKGEKQRAGGSDSRAGPGLWIALFLSPCPPHPTPAPFSEALLIPIAPVQAGPWGWCVWPGLGIPFPFLESRQPPPPTPGVA